MGGKKKPTKLKPIKGTSKRSDFTNIAEKFIADDEAEKAAILASKQEEMKKINAELEDFLDVADGGFSNIQELNDAFEGNTVETKEEYDIVYDYREPNGIRLEKRK